MQTENYSRKLAAAFRVRRDGAVGLAQPTVRETLTDRDLATFWIETFNAGTADEAAYVGMYYAAEFYSRERVNGDGYAKTPTLRAWLVRSVIA